MTSFEREIRAMPRWLLQEYLQELGGELDHDGVVRGEGWVAHLTQIEDYQIGSIRVGQVRLELHGDANAVERIQLALEPKLLRAGG